MIGIEALNQIREDVAAKRVECESLKERYMAKLEIVESAERYLSSLEGEIDEQGEKAMPEKPTLAEVALWVLRDGEEQHVQDITRQIEEAGFHIGGRNHAGTISAILSSDRRKRFVKGSRRGYWKRKHPPLSAESEPSEEDAESGVTSLPDFQQAGQREG